MNDSGYINDTLYLIEHQGIIVEVSQRLNDFSNIIAEELVGKPAVYVLKEILHINTAHVEQNQKAYLFDDTLEAYEISIHIKKSYNEIIYELITSPLNLKSHMSFLFQLYYDNHYGIAIYNTEDFVLLSANAKYLEMVSFPHYLNNCIGMKLKDLVPDFVGSESERRWKNIVDSGETVYLQEFEGTVGAMKGRYWENTITPITINGDVKFIVSLLVDITEKVTYKRRIEEKTRIIEEQKKELEAIITERINHEKEMLEAREKAEAANKAKSQFLANMSHEIRTPMNGILGMIEVLKFSNLTDKQKEILSIIKSSSESLLKIINDILDLSKIESGNVILRSDLIDLREFMKDTKMLLGSMATDKGIYFDTYIDENVPVEVRTDYSRLSQVVSNLIVNAIKFTDQGGIKLSIVKCKSVKDKVLLKFSVEDSGIGIKEMDIPKLFSYFTQLDDSRTKRYQGTGLGLAISKGLVELMGGNMGVESIYGIGSTFFFTCLFDIPRGKHLLPPSQNNVLGQNLIKKINILVVDDDPISQLVLKEFCEIEGWKVEVVSNGNIALEKLKDTLFDLIFMDIQMPGMSGIELTERIRENEKTKERRTPIIATTAYAMNEDKTNCLKAGMDDYISKPISRLELTYLVIKWTK